MAAKQILSLVVASTWVVNLLIDNLIKGAVTKQPLTQEKLLVDFRVIGQNVLVL